MNTYQRRSMHTLQKEGDGPKIRFSVTNSLFHNHNNPSSIPELAKKPDISGYKVYTGNTSTHKTKQ